MLRKTVHWGYCGFCRKYLVFNCYVKPKCQVFNQSRRAAECPDCGEFLGYVEAAPQDAIVEIEYFRLIR